MKVVCERCYKSAELVQYAKINLKYGESKKELALCPACCEAFLNAFLQCGYVDPRGGVQGQMDMDAVDTSSDSPDGEPPSPSGKAH